ncbi:hypothetical protein F9633_11815, partial [Staphylococcus pseudintermedius]|nr:hypothetical protein [Staphylococcus pseudintermedius]
MKFKTKKEMTLPQLIEWAWENSIKHKEFTGSRNGIVEFDFRGWVRTDLIEPDEFFEVEVEEEITEDTVIPLFLEVYEHEGELVFLPQRKKSIKDLLEESDLEEN